MAGFDDPLERKCSVSVWRRALDSNSSAKGLSKGPAHNCSGHTGMATLVRCPLFVLCSCIARRVGHLEGANSGARYWSNIWRLHSRRISVRQWRREWPLAHGYIIVGFR